MSELVEKLQWHLFRRAMMQQKVMGFNAHPFTFA
jgi:hypothetical protein